MLLKPSRFHVWTQNPGKAFVSAVSLLVTIAFAAGPALAIKAQEAPSATNDGKVPSFEVAAIRAHKGDDGNHSVNSSTDRVAIGNYTLQHLIRIAYDLKSESQIAGDQDWMDKVAFDISAKIDDSEVSRIRAMKREDRQKERNLLLQSLLADRFHLRVHKIQKLMPVYALVQGKSGAKLAHAAPSEQNHSLSANNGHLEATAISMDAFVEDLTRMPESGERVVVNRTGLEGDFDFKMDWTPDYGSGVPADAVFPGLFTALQDQLGLKLVSEKSNVEVIVIDSAAKPTLD